MTDQPPARTAIASSQTDGIWSIRGLLALGTPLAVISLAWLVFFVPVPETAKDILLTIIGALLMRMSDAYAYFFGSSAGSEKKTDAIIAQGDPK